MADEFVSIDPADCAPGRFGKTELFNRIRIDLDVLNARTNAINPFALTDDFNWAFDEATSPDANYGLNDGVTNKSFPETVFNTNGPDLTTTKSWGFNDNWRFYSEFPAGTPGGVNAEKPSFSVARMLSDTTLLGVIASRRSIMESQAVDPVVFAARIKVSADVKINIGMIDVYDGVSLDDNPVTTGFRGAHFFRVDATNWNVTTNSAGGSHNGTAFAHPSYGAWHDYLIIFNSGQIDFSVDGNIKASLTLDLPTTSVLKAYLGFSGAGIGASNNDIESVNFFSGGLLQTP